MWALAIVAALWPTLAHAQDSGGLPIPGSWWELVLGGATLILTGGFGGSTIIGRLRQGGAVGADTDITARIKAIEDAGRASKEQAATADRDKRLSELEAKVTSLSAETSPPAETSAPRPPRSPGTPRPARRRSAPPQLPARWCAGPQQRSRWRAILTAWRFGASVQQGQTRPARL
jgi:hypothetical protein